MHAFLVIKTFPIYSNLLINVSGPDSKRCTIQTKLKWKVEDIPSQKEICSYLVKCEINEVRKESKAESI